MSLHRMAPKSSHILVAFSGGADSTALAVLLHKLGYRLTLCHVDHGMRAGSELDVFHCRSTALRLGVELKVVKVQVDPPTEARARDLRYGALERVRHDVQAGRIATGHTLNDDAETVRMRLMRGGVGLGIPPVRGAIIRPILQLRRQITEAVCVEAGLLWLNDPSNLDLRLTRNRIRRQMKDDPGSVERYTDIGRRNLACKLALDTRLKELLGSPGLETDSRLSRSLLLSEPAGISGRLVRRALRAAGVEPSGRLVGDILAKALPNPALCLDLPAGLAVWTETEESPSGPPESGGYLIFGKRRPAAQIPRLPPVEVPVPGAVALPDWGLSVEASVESAGTGQHFAGSRGGARRWSEIFDADALGPCLTLRQWRAGDRFHPLRGTGVGKEDGAGPASHRGRGKKLQDFFVDAKVPKAERHTTPILTRGDDIVWVAGHRIDDRFKVTERTRRIALLRIGRVRRSL